MGKWIVVLVLAGALAAVPAATAASTAPGIDVTFVKHVVDPAAFVFAGTTGGAAKGALESRLVDCADCAGAVWTFTFDWIVTADASEKSFLARTTGTFDTTTGAVVLDGLVCSGWHAGDRVHEQGRLVDPGTLTFAGHIVIQPGSAGSGGDLGVDCP